MSRFFTCQVNVRESIQHQIAKGGADDRESSIWAYYDQWVLRL